MPSPQNGGDMSGKRTFFISRAGADKRWAELIAGVVRDAGHEAIYEDQDFVTGEPIIRSMREAAAASDCTILVLSPDYFRSPYCLEELDAALYSALNGAPGRILPVRVASCELPPDLAHRSRLELI